MPALVLVRRTGLDSIVAVLAHGVQLAQRTLCEVCPSRDAGEFREVDFAEHGRKQCESGKGSRLVQPVLVDAFL